MSLYADDNTTILTNDQSIRRFFYHVSNFEKVSGSKVNFKKSNGVLLGKWWHINTFSCIYTFINIMYILSVCRPVGLVPRPSLPREISWHPVLGCPPEMMCPPVLISLAYPDCYLYGYSHAADINRHQDRYNLFAPDRLIRRPQCIVITSR